MARTTVDGTWWAGLRRPIRRVTVGLVVFVVVCASAVLGYVVTGASTADSLYMVVITIFGVGYGEVIPVDTWAERGLAMTLIVAGDEPGPADRRPG